MPAVITGSDMVTALGGAADTVQGLLAGKSGVAPLRIGFPTKLGVSHGYPIEDGPDVPLRAARWLAGCVRAAVDQAGLDPDARVVALVGTGLRELRSVERWHAEGDPLRRRDLHFAAAVRSVLPGAEVHTLSNACAASGYALALGSDLLELGEADAVVVAGCDSMTESMLTMIGRVGDTPVTELRPFEVERGGVLLGEGAAAAVLQPAGSGAPVLGRLLGVAATCDAHHETAPLGARIADTMREAHARAGLAAADVDLVVAHGTATALNDPTEATALAEVFAGTAPGPLVTGLKGALGHTSGGAALMGVLVALEALRTGQVPPTVGLVTPIEEAARLRMVSGSAVRAALRVAQVDAFGFGGVNSVVLVAA